MKHSISICAPNIPSGLPNEGNFMSAPKRGQAHLAR
jgi:hypothetical protein